MTTQKMTSAEKKFIANYIAAEICNNKYDLHNISITIQRRIAEHYYIGRISAFQKAFFWMQDCSDRTFKNFVRDVVKAMGIYGRKYLTPAGKYIGK